MVYSTEFFASSVAQQGSGAFVYATWKQGSTCYVNCDWEGHITGIDELRIPNEELRSCYSNLIAAILRLKRKPGHGPRAARDR